MLSKVANVENKDTTKFVTTKPNSLSLTSTMFSSLRALNMLMKFSPFNEEFTAIILK